MCVYVCECVCMYVCVCVSQFNVTRIKAVRLQGQTLMYYHE